MFMSEVDKEKYPDVKQKYRFERIEDIAKESKLDKLSDSKVIEQDKKLKEDSVSNDNTLKTDKDADFGKGYFIEFLEADDLSTKKEILIANRELISERELDTIYEIYGLKRRVLKKVVLDESMLSETDVVFSTLMGDQVAPRREFIEANAKYVSNLDI